MLKRAMCLTAFVVALALAASGWTTGGEKGQTDKKQAKPEYNVDTWVATADEVIEKMFQMAKVNKNDMIFDLGCGDNRICFMAAKKYGCRGVGIDTNPVRIREAMDMFDKFNKDDAISYGRTVKLPLVETRHGDALALKDIGDATVVVMYMFPQFMNLWFPIAEKNLKPGTRIVSHDYSWDSKEVPGAWEPVQKAIVKSTMRSDHKVILWVVPEKKKK